MIVALGLLVLIGRSGNVTPGSSTKTGAYGTKSSLCNMASVSE